MTLVDLIYITAMVATPIIIVSNWRAIVWCFRAALGVDACGEASNKPVSEAKHGD